MFPIYSHPDSLPTPGIYLSVASSADIPCKYLIITQSNWHLLQHYGYADFSPVRSTESSQMEKFIAEYATAVHREKIHHALRLQLTEVQKHVRWIACDTNDIEKQRYMSGNVDENDNSHN